MPRKKKPPRKNLVTAGGRVPGIPKMRTCLSGIGAEHEFPSAHPAERICKACRVKQDKMRCQFSPRIFPVTPHDGGR